MYFNQQNYFGAAFTLFLRMETFIYKKKSKVLIRYSRQGYHAGTQPF